ncbi:MAG: DUF3489 domain-containing protein [Pseudomonadota bacterium]
MTKTKRIHTPAAGVPTVEDIAESPQAAEAPARVAAPDAPAAPTSPKAGKGRRKPKPAQASAEAAKPAKAPTKIQVLLDLLRRPQGALIGDLAAATGWQVHSVRGALAGHIKKKLNLDVVSEKSEAGRVYRVADREPVA